MIHPPRALPGVLALIALLAPALQASFDAATDGEVYNLDRFVVTDANSLETVLPVRPVLGVYGFETPYQDVPRSITQINPRQFEADIITSYSDFTRYSPAVNQATGQLSNYGSPTIRGSITDIYQNGIRMLVRQQNNRPFTLNAYEAADIVAGPAPVIYGPSARTSGYVNYLTKKPYFDARQTTVTLRLGKLYADGTGFRHQENVTVDTGGPIIPGKLAYRVSYQIENLDSYYRNVDDRFHDIYATLAWLPSESTAVDWNIEYGHFNWKVNNGVNRVTNDLIRNGLYLSGPATPIIQVGSSYFSPVLDPDGKVTGWLTRSRSGTRYLPGTPASDPTGNTPATAGTIVGYVLDPANVSPVELDSRAALNAPGWPSVTDALNTQLRVKHTANPNLTVLNNAIFQYYKTDTASNGGFYNWITSHTFEDRTEGLLSLDYQVLGRAVTHQSNTGFSYRFEEVKNYKDSQANGYGPTGDWYDLTDPDTAFTRNSFFGATVYPFSAGTSSPVLTRFGYLKGFWTTLPNPDSPAFYVTPGGSQTGTSGGNLSTATNHTRTHALSFYSQHSWKTERWILDLGYRGTVVYSRIRNPLPLNDAFAGITDGIRAWNPSTSASLSYRLSPRATVYATYNYVVALNGMTTGSPTWATVNGAPNQYDPANFHSTSELREVGGKFELIPSRLTGTISIYRQTRDLSLTPVPGSDPILAKGWYEGIEASLRYQPSRHVNLGLNYSLLDAVTRNQSINAANPLVADNATNLLGSTPLGLGDWRVINLPRHNVTAFASYQFDGGFGVKADLWLRDSYIANASGSVSVPSGYNLNLGIFYNRPRWSADLTAQNLTNQRNFAGGATLLEPLNFQARITLKL